MENESDLAYLTKTIEKQNERIESIENLLKMMIVNGILREIDTSIIDSYQRVDSEIVDLLLQKGLTVGDFCLINGKKLLNIIVPNEMKISVKQIMKILEKCKSIDESLDICFYFKTIHGNQRKSLIEKHISFCTEKKETHIFTNI